MFYFFNLLFMKNYFLFIFLLLSLNSFTQNYGEWELSEEISDGEELYRMGIIFEL